MFDFAFNGSFPIEPKPDCVDGYVNNVPSYVKDVAAVTCALSVIGSISIILSYVFYKELRNKAREVIVHISLMDLMAASANLIGIIINFDARLYHPHGSVQPLPEHYDTYNRLCIAQAAFGMYGTLASILWTLAIAVYFYIRIMADNSQVTKRSVYFYYIICYGLPLVMVIWFVTTGRLGYSPVGGSGWCSLITVTDMIERDTFTLFFGSSLWIYATFVLIPVIALSLTVHLRMKVTDMSIQDRSRVSSIELKLLAIPIVYVLLRIWSEILTNVAVHTENKSCSLVMFLLVMGGIGDSGQGFFNAIIFCLFNSKVRRAYLATCRKCLTSCRRCKVSSEEEMHSPLINDMITEASNTTK